MGRGIGKLLCDVHPVIHRLNISLRGRSGEESQDYGYNFTNNRRRSNSSSHAHSIDDFKTKFEAVEADPVFEEEFHGAMREEPLGLEKAESGDSNSTASIEEEELTKKV